MNLASSVAGKCGSRDNVNGQNRYAGIWEQTEGVPFQARHNETPAQYQQSFDELLGKGFRLVRVSGY